MRQVIAIVTVVLWGCILCAQDDRDEVRVEAHVEGGEVLIRVAVDGVVQNVGDDAKKDTPDKQDDKKPDKKKDEKVDLSVKVMGVSVRKPTENERRNPFWYGSHSVGTTLTVAVQVNKGRIIGMDIKGSKLRTLSDDLGTMLVKLPEKNAADKHGVLKPSGQWLRAWHIGRNEGLYSFQIGGVNVPAAGAMTITVNAEVSLLWAKKQKTVKVKDVKLKPGTKVKLGLTEMEVTELPAGWGGNNPGGFGLKYTGNTALLKPRIVRFQFYDADGTELPIRSRGSSSSGTHMTRYFNLKDEKRDKLTIELTYWAETQQLKVPVDITTGLGF